MKRVVRSVLGAAIFALADAVYVAFMLRNDLRAILRRERPVRVQTESFGLFSMVLKSSTTTEIRQMINYRAAREAL